MPIPTPPPAPAPDPGPESPTGGPGKDFGGVTDADRLAQLQRDVEAALARSRA